MDKFDVSSGESVKASGNFVSAYLRSLRHPEWMPEGVNRWDEPLDGRVPIVLIHGTWMNAYNTFSMIAPALIETGHPVFAFNYGRDTRPLVGKPRAIFGVKGLLESQREVASFIDEVLERTGTPTVNLLAHSQGVSQARLYLQDSGGACAEDPTKNKVTKVVGLGGASHGTTFGGMNAVERFLVRRGVDLSGISERLFGPAGREQMVDSEVIKHINAGGDTMPGVDYTMICSRFDQVVTPWRTQFLEEGPGARVKNIVIQEGAVQDFSDHLAMLYSPRVVDLICEEFDAAGTWRDNHPGVAQTVLPGLGAVPRWRRRRRR